MTTDVRRRVDIIACDGRRPCAELLPELVTLDVCPLLALRLERRP